MCYLSLAPTYPFIVLCMQLAVSCFHWSVSGKEQSLNEFVLEATQSLTKKKLRIMNFKVFRSQVVVTWR